MDFANFNEIAIKVIVAIVPILIAITFHEASHGFVAYKLGDPTAKMLGRLTLNPIAHIDLIGTIIMPLMLYVFTNGQFVFGYAKPVPVNTANFSNPKRDMALSASAGPLVNIALAGISYILLKYVILFILDSNILPDEVVITILKPIAMMLKASIGINVVLASFNLIPIPPLDGGRVLMGLLPYRQALAFAQLEKYGMIIVLAMVVTGLSKYIIVPIANVIYALIALL